jgi:hypothetical protein
VAEERHLSPDWEALAAWLRALDTRLTVVLDATLYCWWLERSSCPTDAEAAEAGRRGRARARRSARLGVAVRVIACCGWGFQSRWQLCS